MNNLSNKFNRRINYEPNHKDRSDFDCKCCEVNFQRIEDFGEKVQNNNSKEDDFNENLTFTGNKDIKKLLAEKDERYNIEYHLLGFEKEKDEKEIKKAIFSTFEINDTYEPKINNKENFIGKKKKREKDTKKQNLFKKDDYISDISQNNNFEDKEYNVSQCIKLEEKEKVRFGRKKLGSTKNCKHNKFSDDNIINKIKGNFINYFIRDIIKKYSIKKSIDIKKLPREIISDLNKQRNEKLYKMKLSDILLNYKISTKYTSCEEYENRKIINKIYEEKKEIKVIKILELTFEELFIIFRRKLNDKEDRKKIKDISKKVEGFNLTGKNNNVKDIEYLIEFNKKKFKEKMSENELNEYIEQIKRLCLGYERWFSKKIGRTRRKQYDSKI